jgi:dihydrofolate reductase
MPRPALALIAAVARNRAIGKDNQLLWREPADQKFLRRTTLGHPVLMGRKTWDSLPTRFRPLPGRRNLVLTRDPRWQADGAEAVGSIEAAIALLPGADKAYVLGGAEVYAMALPFADELVLTEIEADLPGDVFFPEWDRKIFLERSREPGRTNDGTEYAFVTYARLPPA